jgi:hypothetical protein
MARNPLETDLPNAPCAAGTVDPRLLLQRCSIYEEGQREAKCYKWIVSEQAGHDLGEDATRDWVAKHWRGYLRAKWIEHLEGKTFWIELDRGDFGLLQREFKDHLLLDRILDRLKAGQENLNVFLWAYDWGIDSQHVFDILLTLDINSLRLSFRFET